MDRGHEEVKASSGGLHPVEGEIPVEGFAHSRRTFFSGIRADHPVAFPLEIAFPEIDMDHGKVAVVDTARDLPLVQFGLHSIPQLQGRTDRQSFYRVIGSFDSAGRDPRELELGVLGLLAAFGSLSPLPAAALVLLLMNVAILFPLWPGNVGLYQAAVAAPLLSYGIATTRGVAFGIGLQAIESSVGIGIGMIFLAREGLTYATLKEIPDSSQVDLNNGSKRHRLLAKKSSPGNE